jgi:multidrug efflux pump subunit AcrB
MSSDSKNKRERGAIAWMASNPVAANLLMLVIVVGGLIGLLRVREEVFPEFSLDAVQVSVAYPFASPAEVEQGIVLAVEEAIRGLDGVKRTTATASEGRAVVSAELLLNADPDKVLADIKSAVDRVRSFPEQAERAEVSSISLQREVVSLIISGDQQLSTLHQIAERARLGLLQSPDITQVQISGVPPLELSIEIPQETLEAYGLELEEVARQIRAASVDLPGGGIKTRGGELLVRVTERRSSQQEFAEIVLRGTGTGAEVRLGDIATVRDGYEDTGQASYFDGKPAVRVTAYRVGQETPGQVAGAVKAYAEQLRGDLPSGVRRGGGLGRRLRDPGSAQGAAGEQRRLRPDPGVRAAGPGAQPEAGLLGRARHPDLLPGRLHADARAGSVHQHGHPVRADRHAGAGGGRRHHRR